MRFNRLRAVLLCLLAFALPVQGFAAATGLLCPAHWGAERGLAVAHQAMAPTSALADDCAHASPAQAKASADDATNKKCAACATCCAPLALPAALTTIEEMAADTPRYGGVLTPPLCFLTDGQERPPRLCLA